MMYVKVVTPSGLFVGRIRRPPDLSNRHTVVKLFNPILRAEYSCAALHITEITEAEAKKHFESDELTMLDHYRRELDKLGICLSAGLDSSEARRILLNEKTCSMHRGFLKGRGVRLDQNFGHSCVEQSVFKAHRAANCYSCRAKVDNDWHLECIACGWIVCGDCGACGCGHPIHGPGFLPKWQQHLSDSVAGRSDEQAVSPYDSKEVCHSFLDIDSARRFALENRGAMLRRDSSGEGWVVTVANKTI